MALLNKVLHSEKASQESLLRLNAHRHESHQTPEPSQALNVELSIKLESPPIVLYGAATESTGSIVSGLLFLHAGHDTVVQIDHITLSLVQTIKLNKPFLIPSSSVSSCKNCTVRRNTLARWDVVTSLTKFSPGPHAYPFSHLLPGSLPASSKFGSSASVSFVKYDLTAVAHIKETNSELRVVLPLNIQRAILRGPDRNSLRVFPPTEVSASAVLPNIVYPKSTFPVELKLENMVNAAGDRRWRMRKLSWKIEESTKIRAYTCEKHQPKLKAIQDAQVKAALAKDLKGSAASKYQASANNHYSNIQTDIFLAPSNPNLEATPATTEENAATGLNGAPVISLDTTQVNSTAPGHANENFLEDFGTPLSTAPSNEQSRTAGSTPSLVSAVGSSPSSINEQHMFLSEKRTISHGELKSGWKSDFTGRGKIELVAEINAMGLSTGLTKHIVKYSSSDPVQDESHVGLRNGANFSCDIDDPNEGIFVSHLLLVEIVVAEETLAPQKKPRAKSNHNLTPVASASSAKSTSDASPTMTPVGTPTGAARVLRMQFKVNMTERSGLGISWDDEVPPTYTDVSTFSPPTYAETSAASTPLSAPAPAALPRPTPNVLYGVGDTPGMSMQPGSSIASALELEDRIQDLTL